MDSVIIRDRIRSLAETSVMTAALCVLAPASIPIGPVPISLTNLVIYASLYLLGWKRGTVSVIVYLLLGAAGLPVFSGWSGGIGKLVGPTGGYLVGFVPMAVIAGLAIERLRSRIAHVAAMIIATAVVYALGTLWFSAQAGMPIMASLALCVYPFIPGDLLKIIAAAHICPIIASRLRSANALLRDRSRDR